MPNRASNSEAATEALAAAQAGATALKLFPAGSLGTAYFKDIKAVMPLVELPLVQGRAEEQLRLALPGGESPSTLVPAPEEPIPNASSVDASNRLVNEMYRELCAAKLAIVKQQQQLDEKERQRAQMERNWQEALADNERLQLRVREAASSPSYRAELRGEAPPTKRRHLST